MIHNLYSIIQNILTSKQEDEVKVSALVSIAEQVRDLSNNGSDLAYQEKSLKNAFRSKGDDQNGKYLSALNMFKGNESNQTDNLTNACKYLLDESIKRGHDEIHDKGQELYAEYILKNVESQIDWQLLLPASYFEADECVNRLLASAKDLDSSGRQMPTDHFNYRSGYMLTEDQSKIIALQNIASKLETNLTEAIKQNI